MLFIKCDIIMQYHTFKLDNESQDLCIIMTPSGEYEYARLLLRLQSWKVPGMTLKMLTCMLDPISEPFQFRHWASSSGTETPKYSNWHLPFGTFSEGMLSPH
jgi:hypothetical protein